MSMTKEQVLAVLDLALLRGHDPHFAPRLTEARAAIASWPEPATNPADVVLPPLPEPFGELERSGIWNGARRQGFDDVFDAEQMRAYALAAIAAAQQAAAPEAVAWLVMWKGRPVGYATHESRSLVNLAEGETLLPVFAAPPSMAALTNPKDSDAEASLRALLAELRGLAERWMLADTNSYKHCSRALRAVLSTWTESTQAQNAGSSARYQESK